MLNALHPGVDYPLTGIDIISLVNAAIAGGDPNTIEELKDRLVAWNELGSDLDANGVWGSSMSTASATNSAIEASGEHESVRAGATRDRNQSESRSLRDVDCCGGDEFAEIFDRSTVEADRRRYRRHGPDRTTRQLLDLITPRTTVGATVLDIGGGIGVVGQELLALGASAAMLVDASVASIEAAHEVAAERGTADRLTTIRADFVLHADSLESADIVVLDRVICCYPDVDGLVSGAAAHAGRALGVVLPRDRAVIRLAIRAANLWYRLRGQVYRAFAHSTVRVDRLAADAGLHLAAESGTFWWRVAVYERPAAG